jgi:TatD DNase family protein
VSVAAAHGLRVHLAVGVHPYALAQEAAASHASTPRPTRAPEGKLASRLVTAARRHGAVAIGECGVDALLARRAGPGADLGRQLDLLREHVMAADAATLPLVLHVVRAHQPVLALLRAARGVRAPSRGGPARGVVHAFSGSVEVAQEYVREGFMLAFGGALTHPTHGRARAAASALDDAHLLVESDAPSGRLAGGPARNEPAAVRDVVATLAQLRGQTPERVAEFTWANAQALYRL